MNSKNTLLILAVLLFTSQVWSLDLKTTPLFGVRGIAAENSEGVLIQGVLPQSTAAKMNLQAGDVVTHFNRKKVTDFLQLINLVQALKVGDDLAMQVRRGEQELSLTGKILAKPQEHHQQFEIIYDVVAYKNNLLRSMVYKPQDIKEDEQRPALYYIQGYTCQSVDAALTPDLTMQQLLKEVVLNGYVVYKIEKFNVGDSAGDLKCSEIDFTQEMDGFLAGMKALKKYDFVDSDKVFVFGHSLGGVYAPVLAEKTKIRGIAVYGAVMKPWYDYLLDIFSEQAIIFGTSTEQAKNNVELIKPLLTAWLKSERSWHEIQNDDNLKTAFEANLLPVQGDQVFQRHYTFFRDLNQYNLKQHWLDYSGKMLAMHGAFDIQAISEKWATNLVNTINSKQPGSATYVNFANTDHGLMKYPTMQDLQTAMNSGTYNPASPGSHYNAEVGRALVKWMQNVLEE
ncbi:MAG: PDZ domain-containing protein [Xanthomonadales bacterium]|nr:PDZ domain-containing protein [Xanthomonadales bacterium]